MNCPSWFRHLGASFLHLGWLCAALFFSASLTPSLLPRDYLVQGVLSGLALAVGYGLGVFAFWLWHYLELPLPSGKSGRALRCVTAAGVTVLAVVALWRATVWQNSIRELMEMPPLETAYPTYVALIALLVGLLAVGATRLLRQGHAVVDRHLNRVLPRRIANVLSAVIVGFILLMIANRMIARTALSAADKAFESLDELVDEGIEQPTDPSASGSPESLIEWDSIGRRGKNFIVDGPTVAQLSQFWGNEALRPLRVYVGLRSRETVPERRPTRLGGTQTGGRIRSFGTRRGHSHRNGLARSGSRGYAGVSPRRGHGDCHDAILVSSQLDHDPG